MLRAKFQHFHTDYEGLLDALDVDFRQVSVPYAGRKLFEERPNMIVDPVYGYYARWIEHQTGGYWDYSYFPLSGADDETIANYPVPDADDFDYDHILCILNKNPTRALFVGNGGYADVINATGRVMGMEQTLVNLAVEDEATLTYIRRRSQMELKQLERMIERAKGRIDFMWIGEDLGTQIAPMISMELYNSVLRPIHSQYIELAKAYGLPVMIHSCGSSSWVYEEWIRMGVRAVDTLQPEAKNMQPQYLVERFGGRLCFHGSISTASPLAYGTPKDVEDNVRETCEIYRDTYSYMISPTHSIQDNSPLENVLALYESARKYDVETLGYIPDNRLSFQFDTPDGSQWEDYLGGWKKITLRIPEVTDGKQPNKYVPGRPVGAEYPLPDFTQINFFGPTFRAVGNDGNAPEWKPLEEYLPAFSYFIADVEATDWTGGEEEFLLVEDVASSAESVDILGAGAQDADVEWYVRAGAATGAFSDEKPGYQSEGRSYEFTVADNQATLVAGLKLKKPVDMTPIFDGADVAINFWLYVSDAALFQSKFTNGESQFIVAKSGLWEGAYQGDTDSRFSMDLDWTKFQSGWNEVTFRVRHGGRLTHNRDYYAQATAANNSPIAFVYSEADYIGLNIFGTNGESSGVLNGSAVLRLYDVKAVPVPADMEGDLTVVPLPKEDYNVTFMADGEVVQTIKVKPGETLDISKFPAVPEKQGYTGVWDKTESITNITADVTVTAVYTAQEFEVTVTGGNEGNDGSGTYLCGENVLVRAQTGKTIKEWKVTGVTGRDNGDGTYSFTMPGNNVTVEIIYETETVNPDPGEEDPGPGNEEPPAEGGCGGAAGVGTFLFGGTALLFAAGALCVVLKRKN